jgi:hypothetical protein
VSDFASDPGQAFDPSPIFHGDITDMGEAGAPSEARFQSAAVVVGGFAGRSAAKAARAGSSGLGALFAWALKTLVAAVAEAFKPGQYAKARKYSPGRQSAGKGYYAIKSELEEMRRRRRVSVKALAISHALTALVFLVAGFVLAGR